MSQRTSILSYISLRALSVNYYRNCIFLYWLSIYDKMGKPDRIIITLRSIDYAHNDPYDINHYVPSRLIMLASSKSTLLNTLGPVFLCYFTGILLLSA